VPRIAARIAASSISAQEAAYVPIEQSLKTRLGKMTFLKMAFLRQGRAKHSYGISE